MIGKSKININSLKNKKSNGNQIIYFEYTIINEQNESELIFRYYKLNEVTWRIELVTQPHEEMPYRLFSEVYQLPNNSVPLTVVCGLGLLTIKEILGIEVQYYSNIQFQIAEEISRITNQSANN